MLRAAPFRALKLRAVTDLFVAGTWDLHLPICERTLIVLAPRCGRSICLSVKQREADIIVSHLYVTDDSDRAIQNGRAAG